MKKISLLLALSIALLISAFLLPALAIPAFAQQPTPSRKIDNDFIHQQFGDQFTLLPEIGAAYGDLDGDGVEDVVIAARCKNPLLDQGDHNYTVMDPYNEFFGYGDPRMTTTFSEGDPAQRGLVLLIIYGSGASPGSGAAGRAASAASATEIGWRSATPKAKFVIVNLPYRTLSVRKMKLRKKTIEAVYVEEANDFGDSSALFFDGKKFRYVPMGGDMQ